MFPGRHDDRLGESGDDDGPDRRGQIRRDAFDADLRKNGRQRRGARGHERKRPPFHRLLLRMNKTSGSIMPAAAERLDEVNAGAHLLTDRLRLR